MTSILCVLADMRTCGRIPTALRERGHDVVVEHTFECALLTYSRGAFDMLICEQDLQKQDVGRDLIRGIRKGDPHIDCIMLFREKLSTGLEAEFKDLRIQVFDKHRPYRELLAHIADMRGHAVPTPA